MYPKARKSLGVVGSGVGSDPEAFLRGLVSSSVVGFRLLRSVSGEEGFWSWSAVLVLAWLGSIAWLFSFVRLAFFLVICRYVMVTMSSRMMAPAIEK